MTVTVTEDRRVGLSRIKFAWVGDSNGDASGATTYTYNGQIWQCVTIPGASSLAPDDNYDITLKDDDGVDLLNGLGADRDTANTEVKFKSDGLLSIQSSKMTLAVSNSGDANAGTVIIHLLTIPEIS